MFIPSSRLITFHRFSFSFSSYVVTEQDTLEVGKKKYVSNFSTYFSFLSLFFRQTLTLLTFTFTKINLLTPPCFINAFLIWNIVNQCLCEGKKVSFTWWKRIKFEIIITITLYDEFMLYAEFTLWWWINLCLKWFPFKWMNRGKKVTRHMMNT